MYNTSETREEKRMGTIKWLKEMRHLKATDPHEYERRWMHINMYREEQRARSKCKLLLDRDEDFEVVMAQIKRQIGPQYEDLIRDLFHFDDIREARALMADELYELASKPIHELLQDEQSPPDTPPAT